MMHSDFIEIDDRFSDRETTDREMYLENLTEENVMKEPKMITMKMYVHASNYTENGITLFGCDMSECGNALLGDVDVTFPMPDKDPIVAKVEALEKSITVLQSDTYVKVTAIKEKIQSLLAIGHSVNELDQ